MTDLLGKYRIKFLFKNDLTEEDFDKTITEVFNFLEELNNGILRREIREELENYRVTGRTILITWKDGQLKALSPLPPDVTDNS